MGKKRALGLGQSPVYSSFLWEIMLILMGMCIVEVKIQRSRAEEDSERTERAARAAELQLCAQAR